MTEIPFFRDNKQLRLYDVIRCVCGQCNHRDIEECSDCKCCSNFHQRSSGGILG